MTACLQRALRSTASYGVRWVIADRAQRLDRALVVLLRLPYRGARAARDLHLSILPSIQNTPKEARQESRQKQLPALLHATQLQTPGLAFVRILQKADSKDLGSKQIERSPYATHYCREGS